MRISTNALRKSAILLVAVLALVPQYAFAQLPVETRDLKLQGANSGSVLLKATSDGANYTLQYPNAQGTVGAFLYLNSTNGTLAWSSTTGLADGYTPVWDAANSSITWINPAGVKNPNWSLTGNTLAADGKLGSTNEYGVNFVTNNTTRMSVTSAGVITIGNAGTGSTNVDGVFDVDGNTNVDGTVNINTDASNANATNINTVGTGLVTVGNTGNELEVNAATLDVNSATVTIDGSTTVTGTTNINTTGTGITSLGNTGGGTSITGELRMVDKAGTPGQVLVSKGTQATPAWESVGSAIGIRAAGRVPTAGTLVSPTAATSVTVTGITLQANDAIIVTIDGGGSNIVANVATRTNSASATATDGSFVVQLSASYAGALNYLVIRNQ